MAKFKQGFMLGAATAAHQTEGNNTHRDDWVLERIPHSMFTEPSQDAVDHYHHYAEDIQYLKDAGLNTYRFSIEWARIEPERGRFDETEVKHYQDVIACCKNLGIEPIVTLHHFTSPAWLISEGGWENPDTVERFGEYVSYIMPRIGKDLHYICTINEANMRLQIGTLMRDIMKRMQEGGDTGSELHKVQVGMNTAGNMQLSALEGAQAFGLKDPRAVANFVSPGTEAGDLIVMKAHRKAVEIIKRSYPDIQVGLTLSLHDFQAYPGGEQQVEQEWDEEFLHYLPYIQDDDFVGLQNYTRKCFDATGCVTAHDAKAFTQMGYEDYPQAIGNVIRKVAETFHHDLIVTENGIGTADDEQRQKFLEIATDGVKACMDDGIPVKGYCCWSLLDNYEWQQGFRPTFGLIAVDREHDMKRTPKKSLYLLGSMLEHVETK